MTDPVAIPLGGYVSGGGGTLPILGVGSPEIVSNANLTLSLSQADPFAILVTSDGTSTTIRNVVFPLIKGKTWLVKNQTSEGFPIQVIGSSGTGVTIPSGAYCLCTTDGTNVYNAQPANGVAAVTYQPSGVASGTTFTSFTALVAYLSSLVGYYIVVQFDNSYLGFGNNIVLPAVAFPGIFVQWVGLSPSGLPVPITVPAGFTMPGLDDAGGQAFFGLVNCNVQSHVTAPVTTFTQAALQIHLDGSSITTSTSGSFFSMTGGTILSGTLTNESTFNSGVSHTVVTLDSGNSSGINLSLFAQSIITNNAFVAPSGSSVTVSAYEGSQIGTQTTSGPQWSVSATSDCAIGTITGGTVTYLNSASKSAYSAGAGANWTASPISAGSPPVLVSTALDLLAATVHAGGGGGGGITALTGDGTASGSGSVVLTVVKINGTSVPAGGSLVAGNSNYVSGVSATTWSALNLAGGSGWVTGALPLANLAHGSAAQVLVTNSGATAPAWVSFSGDMTVSASGATSVAKVAGASWPSSGTGVLNWDGTTLTWATAGTAITALTGDVIASGSGSVISHVQALSGPAGAAGAVPLGDGTNSFQLAMLTSLQTTPPTLLITGSSGFSASNSNGSGGGQVGLIAGAGGSGQGTNKIGGPGSNLQLGGGVGGASTGTAVNTDGGDANLFSGGAGTGGSGTAGTPGAVTIRLGGQTATPVVQFQAATSDYVALGGPQSGTGQVAQGGLIRVPHSPGVPVIEARNAGGTGDVNVLGVYDIGGTGQGVSLGSGSSQEVDITAGTDIRFDAPTIITAGGTGKMTDTRSMHTGSAVASQANQSFSEPYLTTVAASGNTTIYSKVIATAVSGVGLATFVARCTSPGGGVSVGDTFTSSYHMFIEASGTTTSITVAQLATLGDPSTNSIFTIAGLFNGTTTGAIRCVNSVAATFDCTFTIVSATLN